MSRLIELSTDAIADLKQIERFSVAQWGEGRADSYLAQIRTVIDNLADFGERGRPLDPPYQQLRRIPVTSHIVYYRVIGMTIEVARVLHQRALVTKDTFPTLRSDKQ